MTSPGPTASASDGERVVLARGVGIRLDATVATQAGLERPDTSALVLEPELLDHRAGRVLTRHTADTCDRVGAGAGEEEPFHGRAVAREPGDRLVGAEPAQRRVDVVDAAVDGPEALLDVRQGKRAAGDLEALDTFVVLLGVPDHAVGDLLAGGVPAHPGDRGRQS